MNAGSRSSSKKPGVRSIAKATGLSVATVSRVLNAADNVRPATRELVTAAMRDLGYTPNSAARALATRRTRTVAAVIPTLAHSIFARYLNFLEQELTGYGYALVIATTGGSPALEHKRVEDMLLLGAEGLIITGATHNTRLRELIYQQDLPTICTSIYAPECGLPTIGYDNEALGKRAVGYLRSLGHRQIAVVHGPLADNDRTRLRLQGAQAGAQREVELTSVETTLDVEGGASAARQLLANSVRPTAILGLSDVLALGVLFEARRFGVQVPQRMSVMGFDDLDWASQCEPPLTTIRLPTDQMGREVARSLVRWLDSGDDPSSIRLEAKIVVRASTVLVPPSSTSA